ncbi:glycosyltransferase family 2 protein [Hyphomicrobium sp.]|jgi:glycosyltransferase involved in cell wall biosynthesis|uniref:glycosyltransferase family 2 protein n=1 Tax=Hyphomicrobium sp. TaxID=82 RepID=UPI00356285F8
MNEILSVIMPVHNAEPYLAAATESVLEQDLSPFELICINDGSTDRSADILKSYSDRDSRIRIIDRNRQGLVASLNDGLKNATAPIIARMDADDICLPGRFAKQFTYLTQNPDVWVVGTGRKLIDGEGREFHTPTLVQGEAAVAAELERSCAVCHPTIMMRRQPILDLGGYREAFAHAEDYDLWLRVVEKAKIDNLPIDGILHRIHGESVSEKHKIQQRVSAALAQACHKARILGGPDPSAAMTAPPDLWSDELLDALIPEHITFFRSMLILFNPAAPYERKLSAVRTVENAPAQVKKQNKKLHQEALIFAANHHRGIDFFKLRSLAAAARMHPTRFFKSAFAARRQIVAPASV